MRTTTRTDRVYWHRGRPGPLQSSAAGCRQPAVVLLGLDSDTLTRDVGAEHPSFIDTARLMLSVRRARGCP
jgi:hypothetical protein